MGKVLNKKRRWLRGAGVGLLGGALLLGCSSAGPRPLTAEAMPPAVEQNEVASQPVLISGLEVRELAPGVALDLTADGPLVWTQYRDPDGRLVLELSNSRPADDLTGVEEAEGILEAVQVETVANADRPLTRLVIETRLEAEHQLAPTEDGLEVVLLPVGEEQVMTASARAPREPVAAKDPVGSPEAPAAEQLPPVLATESPAAAPADTFASAQESPYAGTAEEPFVAPPPQGAQASRLLDVELQRGATPAVHILGDGDFAFSTFQLEDPDRFVVDLQGVVNTGGPSTLEVGDGVLERVRIAQFRSQPEPVSRVVLDLAAPVMPVVERGTDGIALTFGRLQPRTAAIPRTPPPSADVTPAPEPEGVAVAEPVEWRTDPGSGPASAPNHPEPAPAVESTDLEAPSAASPRGPEEDETAGWTPPPNPSSGGADSGQPSDVELYEALQMDEEGMPEVEQAKAPNYASLEVGETEKEYFGEPISFSLRDADIKEVLRTFAKISGLNMVIQPGVRGSVTVELEQVPWDQALEMILKINGLGYELEGNIMRIAPREQLRREAEQEVRRRRAKQLSIPLRTVLKRISYAGAQDVAGLLQSGQGRILSTRGSVVVDGRTNTLIIKELPDYMDTVLAIIDQVDVPEPQVMIEARIIETTKNFSRSLGIEWNFNAIADDAHGTATGLEFPHTITSDGGVSLLTGGANGFLDISMGNILNSFQLDLALQAAETEGLVNILSAPKVATLNNQRASVQSGLQIPIQTVSNNTVTTQFVNATLRLDVTPHVTAEGTVLMDINVQKREPQLAFAVAGATNAPISTKQAQTRVIVRDGGTTVIGGIYKVTSNDGQDRVPGLANIPILGHLFKNRRRSSENDELLIFITPRVLKI